MAENWKEKFHLTPTLETPSINATYLDPHRKLHNISKYTSLFTLLVVCQLYRFLRSLFVRNDNEFNEHVLYTFQFFYIMLFYFSFLMLF